MYTDINTTITYVDRSTHKILVPQTPSLVDTTRVTRDLWTHLSSLSALVGSCKGTVFATRSDSDTIYVL